jgi:hypothetical protein
MPDMNDCMNLQLSFYEHPHTVDHAPAGSDTHVWHLRHIVFDGIDEIHRYDGIRICVCVCASIERTCNNELTEQREIDAKV